MDIVLAMERSLTTARSEAFLRERLRELEASELALAQALSLDERHGVPPHLDADVCLATYLSVQTLERERRSMRMRPVLREQERRLRLFLQRKEEARRTWGWSSGSSAPLRAPSVWSGCKTELMDLYLPYLSTDRDR